MGASTTSRLFRFGIFEADLENLRLTRKGVNIHLQEQPFHILSRLLERPGQIVTRDELRKELWPTGTYVDFDGSLNAALKRLRASLEDDADNPRFIETIPKRGYRFIAPVTQGNLPGRADTKEPDGSGSPVTEAPKALANQVSTASASKSSQRFAIIGTLIFLLGIAALFAIRKRAAPARGQAVQASPGLGQARSSIAILGFQNASGRGSDAWLSTALTEMLSTELGAGGKVRVVPGENVAQFRLGSPWSEADSLSQQTTSRIGKALDSNLLVLGSFATLGEPQTGSVRVDFRLQDAQTGEILYEGAETGTEKQFFAMVSKVGTALRERLGLPTVTESEAVGVVSSLPLNPEADRFYALGVEKMHDEDVAAAKDLFLQAEAIAPDFPLVHLMLSRSWGALGYDQKSRAEAKKAFDLSGSLPETDKLLVEAAYYESLKDLGKAATAYRALFSVYPDSVDYGIRLVNVLHTAGRREEALAIVKQLRQLPPPASDDPRIDYAQSLIVGDTNIPESQPLLDKAITQAAAQGQKLLYARLRLQQCIGQVYGAHPQGAVAYCQEAYDTFIAAGNTLLAADALRTMGDRRGAKGDFSGARELYRSALVLLGKLGEHEKTGIVLNNMAITYENQGQIDESRRLFRQAVQTWTECGDTLNAGVALGNLADISMGRGQLRLAEEQYESARKQIASANPTASVSYELYSIAAIRLYRGDVAGAQRYADQALATSRKRGSVPDIAQETAFVGDIQMARGDLPGARQTYQQALSLREQLGNKGGVAENRAALADVSIEEGKLSDAEAALRESLAEFQAEKTTLNEISAETDLSRVLLREGEFTDARQTISDALAHSANSRDPSLRLPVAIQDAQVEAAELGRREKSKPDLSEPRRKLQSVVAAAKHLGYYGIECDARLALGELEMRTSASMGRSHLADLAKQAHDHGLDLVARKASKLLGSAEFTEQPASKQ